MKKLYTHRRILRGLTRRAVYPRTLLTREIIDTIVIYRTLAFVYYLYTLPLFSMGSVQRRVRVRARYSNNP